MTISRYLFLFISFSTLFLCPAIAQVSSAPLKLVDIILSPDRADWNYKVNEKPVVEVTVLQYGVPLKDVSVSFEAGPELFPPDAKGKLSLREGRGKIEPGTSRVPGFRTLVVRTVVNGQAYSNEVKLAFSPGDIKASVGMPEDFKEFWRSTLQESAKVPMDARLTYIPEQSTASVDVYLLNLQSFREGNRLYGYLCKPKAAGKYPVVFEPPGAGIKPVGANTRMAAQGFIVFSSEIHGISPLLDKESYADISNAFSGYATFGLDNRDDYYYKKVYAGCSRAIDYLRTLPEFDGRNVFVTGGSQGGALSIVTAALNEHVTALVAFYPALADHTGYLQGRAGGWPHLLRPGNANKHNTPAKIKTLEYYDVVNFAKNLRVPGFFSWGYNDHVTPPTSVYATVNSVTAPKTVVVTPISGHWRFGETNQQSIDWLKTQMRK